MTKNADIAKYEASGYGIGFDRKEIFIPGITLGRNVIIFGVDMSSSTTIDNRKKDILILGRGPTQGLQHTLVADKIYSISFTVTGKKFCLSLHYNGANSYLSKNWTVDNMKKTGLKGYVYDYSVDYDAIAVVDILDIHNHLMEKTT